MKIYVAIAKYAQLQLQLTAEQHLEDFTRVLTANDPNVPNNITKYNYKEKAYKQDPEGPMDHLVFHFQLDGCSLHKESEDVVQQQEFEDNKKMEIDRLRKEAALEAFEVSGLFRIISLRITMSILAKLFGVVYNMGCAVTIIIHAICDAIPRAQYSVSHLVSVPCPLCHIHPHLLPIQTALEDFTSLREVLL